jgi:hypothetical protein
MTPPSGAQEFTGKKVEVFEIVDSTVFFGLST